jgi:threonine/homoserine/homoserine lactone efflux protein
LVAAHARTRAIPRACVVTPLTIFIRAFGIGLVVAVPVGAMALRCIERTLSSGRMLGYATGAGIATADATYAGVAAFGLTALSAALTGVQPWIRIIGGAFLVYVGAKALLAPTGEKGSAAQGRRASYGSAVLLTLANPQTILMFAGIFAGAGLAVSGAGWWAPATTVAGVFAGSLAWWVVLVSVVSVVRDKLGTSLLTWVTRVSGLAIAGFGVATIVAGALFLAGV